MNMMTMKTIRIIQTAAASLLLVAVSCGKETGQDQKPAERIVFVAGSVEQPVSRTAYQPGTGKGQLWWQPGDMVDICCVNSDGTSKASYSASPSEEDAREPVLVPLVEAEGLVWGEGEHTFYSLYPSSQMEGADGFALNGNQVTLVMPDTQTPSGSTSATESGVTTTTLAPNMVYAPLIASKIEDPGTGVASVQLRYKAAFTAFEFVVKVSDAGELRLTDFTLSSAETTLALASVTATITGTDSNVTLVSPMGSSLNLENLSWVGSNNTGSGNPPSGNCITIPLGTSQNPFILSGGNTLIFTVLALPFEDIRKVTVRFNTTTGYRQLALKYSASAFAANGATLVSQGKADEDGWIIFPKGKKIAMSGFNVPGFFYLTYGDITISGAPYELVGTGDTWEFVPYDISMESLVIDGQPLTTQNPDSAWGYLLQPVSMGNTGSSGQPYTGTTTGSSWNNL